ncbi:MAG: FKBP-type peptidyl-prolyl cis-trans isomerase [Saprospiraceae bacterium]|nr:FKBP-type peptidyl-prolyl cis-trans isomerase [Saprospiraceae bacterium]MDZ4706335.1 FKBP-type peptidyl-prolyl cis-trans isomerase [Saprospiraceae bacterium]
MKRYFRIFPFLVLSACGPQQPADQATPDAPVAPARPLSEDDLMLRLASELEANVGTQSKVDQNIIVNYAMENFLDIQKTPSGLYYQILAEGQGNLLHLGDHLLVHYHGTFHNGVSFDSSYSRNKPIECYIGKMIPGWNEGLQLTRLGGKIRLFIPSELGYGTSGLKNGDKTIVPPNAVLVFEVEVLEML